MGQNPPKTQSFGLSGQWHKFKRGNLHHCFNKVELLQLEGQLQQISIICAPIESKSNQQIIEIYKYYQTRSKFTQHHNLTSLLKFQLIDSKGNDITAQIQRNIGNLQKNNKDKVNVNTLCNLNIFEGYCNRTILEEKTRIYGQIKIIQEYFANNLQFESEKRRQKRQPYSEKELFDILITAVQAALMLLNSQLKQPLLSPLAIKIAPNGKLKLGEWECTHFFEDKHENEEETNFIEEGEMYLQPEITSNQKETENQFTQFNILTHYYWAPEGTTAMQSTMNLGVHNSRSSCKGQIFSLGMTILHLLLERPLYQKQTYSERVINQYIQEAADYRQTSKQSLSVELISILKKMLAWDPKERINYSQLEGELLELREKFSQRSRSIWSSSAQGLRSVRVPIAKSVIVRDIDGSGSVDQGYGDQTHPQAEAVDRPLNTLRVKTQECSFDYQKIDYTIRRERKEWQLFQNRLSSSNCYKSQRPQLCQTQPACSKHLFYGQTPSGQLCQGSKSFPAQIMLQQDQDYPNEDQLCSMKPDDRKQLEVTDQEQSNLSSQQNYSGVTDSIKLLDISNIKVKNSVQKSQKNKMNLQSTQKLFGHLFENQESFSNMLHGKNINVQAFMNESDSLLLKSSVSPKLHKENQNTKPNEELFTSPELMALIRSSAYRPKDNQPSSYRNAKLELSPQPVVCKPSKTNNELTFSTYVKEQFAKGWYEGGKSQGLRNGYGTFHYNQGGKYCGDWLNSQMHGQGTLYYADGRIAYQGEWRFDSLNGKGILYNENPKTIQGKFDYRNFNFSEDVWVYYQGNFVNDDKNGQGILLLSNGERYEGDFQDDLIQGYGTFYSLQGEIIKGEWRANRLVKISSIDQNETIQTNSNLIQTKY